MKCKGIQPLSKLDRRRLRSIENHLVRVEREATFDALCGGPGGWPPGVKGQIRLWKGESWEWTEDDGYTGWAHELTEEELRCL